MKILLLAFLFLTGCSILNDVDAGECYVHNDGQTLAKVQSVSEYPNYNNLIVKYDIEEGRSSDNSRPMSEFTDLYPETVECSRFDAMQSTRRLNKMSEVVSELEERLENLEQVRK